MSFLFQLFWSRYFLNLKMKSLVCLTPETAVFFSRIIKEHGSYFLCFCRQLRDQGKNIKCSPILSLLFLHRFPLVSSTKVIRRKDQVSLVCVPLFSFKSFSIPFLFLNIFEVRFAHNIFWKRLKTRSCFFFSSLLFVWLFCSFDHLALKSLRKQGNQT